MNNLLKGRKIYPGKVSGDVLFSSEGLSFFGGVDPDTGIVSEANHPLFGKSIKNKILVFPQGKGSTVGSYALYRMKKQGTGPLAIINTECETIVSVGCIISTIPCVDKIDITKLKDAKKATVDGAKGEVSYE